MAVKLVMVGLYVSLPSLLTRAGEISPFISNMVFVIAVGVLISQMRVSAGDFALASLFLAATLMNDCYKYSIALRGGIKGVEMGKEVVAGTPVGARRVLWIGVDEYRRDKAGASFNMSPYRAFGQGSAALRELGYPSDFELFRYKLSDREGAEAKADSIANVMAKDFDCVWLTKGSQVKVITPSDL